MELKGAAICCVDELKMFQSHLYGIERNWVYQEDSRWSCFNRTFMELKVINKEDRQR